jgi:aminomethyltransferase
MGQIELAGAGALDAVQWMTSNDASRLAIGQVQYSALMADTGGFVDDVLVYRQANDHFLLVVNAGNIMKDHEWIVAQARRHGDVAVVNSSSRYALIALQGPASQEVLQKLTGIDLASIKYYWFANGEVASVRAIVSRTGYTGEDGFEVFVPPAQAEKVWDAILDAGKSADVRPCGLGARDTLRLEAAMRLYGNEMDENTTVLEAGLGWIVGWKKNEFQGSAKLKEQKERGVARKLVTFEMRDRAIARHGYAVLRDGSQVGTVTSGTQTPFLKKAIGMAMVPIGMADVGSPLEIDVRGRRAPAEVVPEPFYKRPKPAKS